MPFPKNFAFVKRLSEDFLRMYIKGVELNPGIGFTDMKKYLAHEFGIVRYQTVAYAGNALVALGVLRKEMTKNKLNRPKALLYIADRANAPPWDEILLKR